ncbi:hypothetical protein POL68_19415 [Stigmatella sp. ncwal1]|uniref:Uncharacterized protein n=1 Tax=Stigmatella ashevillensis TaxID=2995309 RepID=A0ABT5DAI9_9BACT|nr:hypothetical protein [Stigmatella ashevillena]MDC0710654.1 hypothetical protein [Stigmatella ashevillena]
MSTKPTPTWKVLSHGPLERLSENLWRVEGSLPRMSLKRVMTVARRDDGSLVIHNGIALEEPVQRELEALGPLAILIVPNKLHRLDAPAYKQRYPSLRVFAPSGGRREVEEKVPVDGVYEDFPHGEDVRLEMLHGVKEAEGAMLVRSKDGTTVVLNDAVFNMDRKRDVLGFLFTTLMGSAPGPRVSRLAKLALVKDAKALRADLERYAALPGLVRLIVSHEKLASGAEAAQALRLAATYL